MGKNTLRDKKKKIFLGTIISLGMAMAIWNQDNMLIRAKPNDGVPIFIDKGSDYENGIPYDGVPTFEIDLLEKQPSYFEYLQNEDFGYSVQKLSHNDEEVPTTAFSSSVGNTMRYLYKTKHGNFIGIQEFTTYPYGSPYKTINAAKVLLISPNGTLMDSTWVYKKPEIGLGGTGSTSTTYGNFLETSNNTYTMLYATVGSGLNSTVYEDAGDHIEIISDHKEIDISSADLEKQTLQQYSINSVGDVMISGVIRTSSSDLKYYRGISIRNGFIQDKYKLESTLQADETTGWNTGSYALIQNLYPLSNRSYIGIEQINSGSVMSSKLVKWDMDEQGKVAIPNVLLTGDLKDRFFPVPSISDENNFYFQWYKYGSTSDVELWKLDTKTLQLSRINTYPQGTNIQYMKTSDGQYLYVGQVDRFEGFFEKWHGKKSGVVTGVMDQNFKAISLGYIAMDFIKEDEDTKTELAGRTLLSNGNDGVVLAGDVTVPEKQFITKVENSNFPGVGDENASAGEWISQESTTPVGSRKNTFISFLKTVEDYSPVIKAPKGLMVNQDDPALQNIEARDNYLLTGTISGDYGGTDAVKVYDNFDLNKSLDPKDQEWLNNRVNRNTKKNDNPIDWKALGFDFTQVGSQLVTYFVSDSEEQMTSTSSRVNVITNQTVHNKEGALDVHHFHIPLKQVTQLTDMSLRDGKKYAKLTAWDMEAGEDISKLSPSEGVEIDDTQLQKIRNTSKEGVFDLTFRLNYGDVKKEKTIKVFVGGEKVGDYVFYSTDFTIPWDISRNTTSEELLSEEYGKVSAYQISKGTEMSNLKVSDDAVVTFKAIDPVSGDVTQLLPIQILEPETNKVLAESTISPNGTVYYRYEEVVVQFVDEAYQLLYDENDTNFPASTTLGERIVGKQLNIAEETDIKTQKATIEQSKGYEFLNYYQADMQTVYPIEGLEVPYMDGKGWTAYLQFKGTLRFIKVPETMSFDNGKVSAKDQKLDASSTNESMFIGDNRTAQEKDRGWRLYAKINQEFVSLDNDRLSNILYYNDQPIAKSNVEIKMNNSVTKTEVKLTKDSGLNLRIPGGTAKKKTYGAAIIWELTAAL